MRAPACAVLILAMMLGPDVLEAEGHARCERLVVLDLELTGDLGGPRFTSEHDARLRMESARLRRELADSRLYHVVDNAPARALIDRLKSEYRYLHDCNGCDLDIGRALNAEEVLVAWVDRVSGLILTLTYEIHDVASRQIVDRRSYDFRGDNDVAWSRAIAYMVNDMRSRGGHGSCPTPPGQESHRH